MIHIRDDVPYKGQWLGLTGTYENLDHFLRVVRHKMVKVGAASEDVNEAVKHIREV